MKNLGKNSKEGEEKRNNMHSLFLALFIYIKYPGGYMILWLEITVSNKLIF